MIERLQLPPKLEKYWKSKVDIGSDSQFFCHPTSTILLLLFPMIRSTKQYRHRLYDVQSSAGK